MLAILDCGIGNTTSVKNAFDYIGAKSILTRDPGDLMSVKGIVLPGVGAFGEFSRRLDQYNLSSTLMSLIQSGMPVLGICLGFQLFMRSSEEMGCHYGFDLFASDVIRLPVVLPVPHVGWSQVKLPENQERKSRLLIGIDQEYFYFVHSYAVVKPPKGALTAVTSYSDCTFVSLIESDNIFGTQFHPEKSGESGLQLLRNFLNVCQ